MIKACYNCAMQFVLVFFLLIGCSALVGEVENSIIPLMNALCIKEIDQKVNAKQFAAIKEMQHLEHRIRVLSFNMLFNLPHTEIHLPPQHRWVQRKERVLAYLLWSQPDLIGTQELQTDQIEDLMHVLQDTYDYYGVSRCGKESLSEVSAIFYRKDRFACLEGSTFLYPLENPRSYHHAFTVCHFQDKQTGNTFLALNTHLSFGNIEHRYQEACLLRDFILSHTQKPLLITGDFNTFPFEQELELPFYDGPSILGTLLQSGIIDSMSQPLFGHFGPLASTNFCPQKKQAFSSLGTPGVILDHIFVSPHVHVLAHGIDPAKVNGDFPSDHFPVVVDLLIPSVP